MYSRADGRGERVFSLEKEVVNFLLGMQVKAGRGKALFSPEV